MSFTHEVPTDILQDPSQLLIPVVTGKESVA